MRTPNPVKEGKEKDDVKPVTSVEVKLVNVQQIPQTEAFQVGEELLTTNQMLVWIANKLLDLEDALNE